MAGNPDPAGGSWHPTPGDPYAMVARPHVTPGLPHILVAVPCPAARLPDPVPVGRWRDHFGGRRGRDGYPGTGTRRVARRCGGTRTRRVARRRGAWWLHRRRISWCGRIAWLPSGRRGRGHALRRGRRRLKLRGRLLWVVGRHLGGARANAAE